MKTETADPITNSTKNPAPGATPMQTGHNLMELKDRIADNAARVTALREILAQAEEDLQKYIHLYEEARKEAQLRKWEHDGLMWCSGCKKMLPKTHFDSRSTFYMVRRTKEEKKERVASLCIRCFFFENSLEEDEHRLSCTRIFFARERNGAWERFVNGTWSALHGTDVQDIRNPELNSESAYDIGGGISVAYQHSPLSSFFNKRIVGVRINGETLM